MERVNGSAGRTNGSEARYSRVPYPSAFGGQKAVVRLRYSNKKAVTGIKKRGYFSNDTSQNTIRYENSSTCRYYFSLAVKVAITFFLPDTLKVRGARLVPKRQRAWCIERLDRVEEVCSTRPAFRFASRWSRDPCPSWPGW